MKKYLLLLTFAFGSFYSVNAQFIEGKPISELDTNYVLLNAQAKAFKPFQVTVYADYGQIGRIKEIKKGYIYEDASQTKQYSFNGVVGALNLFYDNGYELKTAYPVTSGLGGLVYQFLLMRKKN